MDDISDTQHLSRMNMMNHINFALRPYDSSLEDHLSMYDHLPYSRDESLCSKDCICLKSGNVVKHYRYIANEPYVLDKVNDMFEERFNTFLNKKELSS